LHRAFTRFTSFAHSSPLTCRRKPNGETKLCDGADFAKPAASRNEICLVKSARGVYAFDRCADK
jgi:hypothetical protein